VLLKSGGCTASVRITKISDIQKVTLLFTYEKFWFKGVGVGVGDSPAFAAKKVDP
jgi:hypothetical protein